MMLIHPQTGQPGHGLPPRVSTSEESSDQPVAKKPASKGRGNGKKKEEEEIDPEHQPLGGKRDDRDDDEYDELEDDEDGIPKDLKVKGLKRPAARGGGKKPASKKGRKKNEDQAGPR